jgi:CRP-like cAMP-binding protein
MEDDMDLVAGWREGLATPSLGIQRAPDPMPDTDETVKQTTKLTKQRRWAKLKMLVRKKTIIIEPTWEPDAELKHELSMKFKCDPEKVIQILRQHFPSLTEESAWTLAEEASLVTYRKSDLIIRQGDLGDSFYLIRSGSVAVYAETETHATKIAVLKTGNFFGELSILTNAVRSTTCEASSRKTELFTWGRGASAFDALKEDVQKRHILRVFENRKRELKAFAKEMNKNRNFLRMIKQLSASPQVEKKKNSSQQQPMRRAATRFSVAHIGDDLAERTGYATKMTKKAVSDQKKKAYLGRRARRKSMEFGTAKEGEEGLDLVDQLKHYYIPQEVKEHACWSVGLLVCWSVCGWAGGRGGETCAVKIRRLLAL